MRFVPLPLAFADGGTANALLQLVPILVIFAIFYVLLIAPVRRRQKALQKLIDNLKKGDKVLTNGGLYGEVAAIDGKVLHLKLADNLKVRVAKSAVAGLEGGED